MMLRFSYLLLLLDISALPTEERSSLLTPFQLIILHMMGDSPEIRRLLPQLEHAGRYLYIQYNYALIIILKSYILMILK